MTQIEKTRLPPHPVDGGIDNLFLDDFTYLMREKLRAARAKNRWGWWNPAICSVDKLRFMLIEHFQRMEAGAHESGFIDIANLAMMCYYMEEIEERTQDELSKREPEPEPLPDRPLIVCLCGSTKFKEQFQQANLNFTLGGYMVLSVGCFMHAEKVPISEEEKIRLDELHFRKIEMADEVHVINVDGYVGDSTSNEIRHAIKNRKKLTWWEPDKIPYCFKGN